MIVFTRSAERDMDKLDRPVKGRLGAALAAIEPDTRRSPNVRKMQGAPDRYRLRVGDYRIVYDLVRRDLVVLLVSHRSDVYKRARRRGDL